MDGLVVNRKSREVPRTRMKNTSTRVKAASLGNEDMTKADTLEKATSDWRRAKRKIQKV